MATSGERKALWFFVFVALSGAAVRTCGAPVRPPVSDAEAAALERQIARVDSVRAESGQSPRRRSSRQGSSRGPRDEATAAGTASGPAQPVDIDRAGTEELVALPGIGPALAGRIIANRDSAGPFGTLDALCDVRGIGPALAARLRPLVTFSGSPRPVSAGCDGGSKGSRTARDRGHRQPR